MTIYWTLQFKKQLKFTEKETKLFSLSKSFYMKPLDLKHSLNTNNKIIKHRKTSCKKCNKCGLWGTYVSDRNVVYEKYVLTVQNTKV